MGQSINLVRDGEKAVVYGPNQARVMIAQGWRVEEEAEAQAFGQVNDLTMIKGVGEALAGVLADAGYRNYVTIVEAPTEKLIALDKISPRSAENIQAEAAKLI
jgi:predicted flap endonuclease-1-like 5' DNA nuclease